MIKSLNTERKDDERAVARVTEVKFMMLRCFLSLVL